MAIKDQIIKLLEENRNQWLSGQDMADYLKVSRAAIWKAMKTLEKEGFQISAMTNLGYRLNVETDVLSKQGIAHYLSDSLKDIPIQIFKTIDSTNTELKKQAIMQASDRTLIVADEQTSGKGRFNRSFYSPNKTGIYMSLLLRSKQSLTDATILTMQTAIAIRRAIKIVTNKDVSIKWVNDLFYHEQKVCGILTEAMSDFESGMLEAVIIGIGINLNTEFNNELKEIATSLGFQDKSRNQLIAEIINQLFIVLDESVDSVLKEYKESSCILNKMISFKKGTQDYIGTAVDINSMGHLIVQVGNEQMILQAGEVSIRRTSDDN